MLKTGPLDYFDADLPLHGYLARDDAAPVRRPGVLVVHEAFGVQVHVKGRAERLATELGYVALAADLYGKMPAGRDQGLAMAGALRDDPAVLRRRIRAALSALRSVPLVDPDRIVAVGYCLGGTAVLELARDGADVRAVVSCHGGLTTKRPAAAGAVTAKVLSCVGAADPFIPAETVRAFEAEMTAAGADWQSVLYGGTVHSFTNPGSNLPGKAEYNAAADRRSWAAMRALFDEALAPA